VLKKQLLKLGYEVSIANHGVEALDFLETTRFSKLHHEAGDGVDLSVVLMDSEMPVMDGLTAVRRIREMEREGTLVEHVPVIAITANARIEQVDAALVAGMDDVVAKPFRVPELVAQIERLERVMLKRKRDDGVESG
jgi:CheY-like chemotaxis protein